MDENKVCGKCNEKNLNFNKQILKQKDIISNLEAKLNMAQHVKVSFIPNPLVIQFTGLQILLLISRKKHWKVIKN